jgi:putative Mn2+ efflux pump MntP
LVDKVTPKEGILASHVIGGPVGNLELLATAFGLAMDALAVSIASGAVTASGTVFLALKLGLLFGFFQAFMPLVGWLAGVTVAEAIAPYDHWVAFGLLGIVGGHMLLGALRHESGSAPDTSSVYILLLLAIATSIDALAVGLTLSVLDVPIILAVSVIGLVTFGASFAGVFVGRILGTRLESKAEFVGGVVLILIGARILIQHLFGIG